MAGGVEELVERSLAGDQCAQRDLYEQVLPKVNRLVVRMVGVHEAADVIQQVFLKVFRGLAGFRKKANFSTWLYRVVVNECLQHHRRKRPRLQELPEDLPDHDSAFDRRLEQAELLQQALEQLDAELRTVFLLREVEGLSYDQIARVLEIPAGTVASQLNRARTELRKYLTKVLSE